MVSSLLPEKLYFIALFCLYSIGMQAQSVKLDWAKSMGGTMGDAGYSISKDIWGDIYVAGSFAGTADFDPSGSTFNMTSNGNQDVFIQKLDGIGNFIWAKSIGGKSYDDCYSITTDIFGNIYVTGVFQDTVDFDPGTATNYNSSNGWQDYYIQKLDGNGNFIWAKTIGGMSIDEGLAIATDTTGNVYVTGCFQDTVDFNPGAQTFNLISKGHKDIFIQKLDGNGNFIWAKSLGSTSDDIGYSIITDDSNNVYITGIFENTLDFDPGISVYNLTSNGLEDIYILKLNGNGNFVWAKSIGGISIDQGMAISTDTSGNIYVTGSFNGTVDFNPSGMAYYMHSNGYDDVFIQKIDENGNLIWAKSLGGAHGERGSSVAVDISGNVYITGKFTNTVDFDPNLTNLFNLTSNGYDDLFIQKLDENGDFIYAKSIGGISYDQGNSITADDLGNVFVTGLYKDTVDFDPGIDTFKLISKGMNDVFVLKLEPCNSTMGTALVTACASYTWIDGITYTASTTSSTFAYTSSNGCDSNVTLNLTIYKVDVSVSTNDPTITANANGASYQWLDCSNNFAIINGETAQTFTPTLNGSYAVEVTKDGCTDTSECITVSRVGLEKNTLFNGVSIFPNPSDRLINIGLGELKEVSLKVYSDYGQLIYQKENITEASYQFELNTEPGFYIIELSSQGEKQHFKLVRK